MGIVLIIVVSDSSFFMWFESFTFIFHNIYDFRLDAPCFLSLLAYSEFRLYIRSFSVQDNWEENISGLYEGFEFSSHPRSKIELSSHLKYYREIHACDLNAFHRLLQGGGGGNFVSLDLFFASLQHCSIRSCNSYTAYMYTNIVM
jgi:hypothetical protein